MDKDPSRRGKAEGGRGRSGEGQGVGEGSSWPGNAGNGGRSKHSDLD